MARNWDRYSRQGIDLAHTVTSFGFSAAKSGTRLGFSIARGVASAVVGTTSTVVDLALFGGSTVARPALGYAVSTVFTIAEQITLAPIYLSEYITSTSLLAAHSSINLLSAIFPGSSDASFSLASFIDLVRREWNEGLDENGPERQYGITQVARALVGWISLQGVTQEWQEKRWLKYLKELDVKDAPKQRPLRHRTSRIRVTSDVIFPGNGPQIIAADIGEPEPSRSRTSSLYLSRTRSHLSLHSFRAGHASIPSDITPPPLTNAELKATMRRLSKMVLAGYGGASLLFFGVSPTAFGSNKKSDKPESFSSPDTFSAAMAREKTSEEKRLTRAIDEAEAEADEDIIISDEPDQKATKLEYSWWDMLLGKHDKEIFERFAEEHTETVEEQKAAQRSANKGKMKATAVIGQEHLLPRFWVLTDHSRGQVLLVIRGTMSLNEIAVDLTCDPEPFQPATTPVQSEDDDAPVPGQFAFPSILDKDIIPGENVPKYHVHGGMLRMAKAMGDIGKPVHLAVLEALHSNPEFDLVLCGHSLGAGVATLLGMMWADPKTCLTVRSSGIPAGRHVQVYAIAPPALTDAALCRLAAKMVVSFVYSHDIVARLSLGSVRDLKNAALWLCEAESNGTPDGWSAVTSRAKRWKEGNGHQDDMDWFIAIRKTLEANMQNVHMFPTGRVLLAMRDSDLHPAHRQPNSTEDKLRLFEVLDVEKVFSQIIFARNMLTAHLPHQYDRVLHDLL
ncbi:hypothetical protein CPB84DRAFT_1709834 [Gymnopilus junonius]|uniref:sn-1-specific diacylglycerol lipase n=1 Tax=Gymnopilus junonius TaxID=109634 RepID=A0A9P5TLI4_GYMJU|nr:hypothetical protein CPB84DRAFT_1709834 [Gymnopilus junonius]